MAVDMYWRGTWLIGATEGYHQFNWHGMSRCEETMEAAGMLCHPEPPSSAEWNALPDFIEDWEQLGLPYGGVAYFEAKQRLTLAHRGECAGIPAYKFHSNDGWVVTPAEIRAALRAVQTNPPDDPPKFWPVWLDYLREAESHGGIEVH